MFDVNMFISNKFMEKNLIFIKKEVLGTTKDEAIENAQPLNLRVDATQAYKKWAESHAVTESGQNEFFKEYLAKKKFTMPNDGAYVVLQPGVSDTRMRPYKVNDIKYEAKTHTPESWYVVRTTGGQEVAREKTKKAAEQAGKDHVIGFKESVVVDREWAPKEKNSRVMTIDYTPSKGSRPAKLLTFGYIPVETI